MLSEGFSLEMRKLSWIMRSNVSEEDEVILKSFGKVGWFEELLFEGILGINGCGLTHIRRRTASTRV